MVWTVSNELRLIYLERLVIAPESAGVERSVRRRSRWSIGDGTPGGGRCYATVPLLPASGASLPLPPRPLSRPLHLTEHDPQMHSNIYVLQLCRTVLSLKSYCLRGVGQLSCAINLSGKLVLK